MVCIICALYSLYLLCGQIPLDLILVESVDWVFYLIIGDPAKVVYRLSKLLNKLRIF